MALAEVADRSEVRRIERDYHHEIVPLAAGSSNAPRRIQPACIAMQQKRNHHTRIERRLAEPTHIAAHDRLEIQTLPHQPNDKPRDVVLRHESRVPARPATVVPPNTSNNASFHRGNGCWRRIQSRR